MSNFLYDQTALPGRKGDVRAVRNTVIELSGDEVNKITAALADLREHSLSGNWIDPRKYGYKGNDIADDTSSMLQSKAAAIASGVNAIMIPPGTSMRLSSMISFDDVYGFRVFSPSRAKSRVKWYGASGGPVFRVRNSQHVSFERLFMQGNTNPSNRPNCFVQSLSDTSYARTYVPTALRLSDMILGTGASDEATFGVRYSTSGSASDTNNSEGKLEDVLIQGVTEYGYSFEHSQSKAHQITHGGVVGAKGAVSTNQVGGQGGSFSWFEAAASNLSVVCFDIGSPNDPIKIFRLTSEGCKRLLTTGGPSAAPCSIDLDSCRFATDALHADGRAVIYKFRGPLDIHGCNFDSGGAPAKIALHWNAANVGVANVWGNMWNSQDSNLQSPFELLDQPGIVNHWGNSFADHNGLGIPDVQSGTVTVADTATTGSVTFNIPEHDTGYRFQLAPATITGGAASGSWRLKSVAKTTSGLTFTVEAAPGAGTSVTFDWSITRR